MQKGNYYSSCFEFQWLPSFIWIYAKFSCTRKTFLHPQNTSAPSNILKIFTEWLDRISSIAKIEWYVNYIVYIQIFSRQE